MLPLHSLCLAPAQNSSHDVPVKKMAENAVTQVMHESCEHYTFLVRFTKRDFLRACLLPENVHLLVAEIGNATAVLEAVVRRAREHVVVWS